MKKLILKREPSSQQELSISFNIPSKSFEDSFISCANTSNLRAILSKDSLAKDENSNSQSGERDNSNGSICIRIANLLKEAYGDRIDDSKEQKRDITSRSITELKINSVPIINAFDLRLF